ncbi:helix-turn-helix domain-containing protein [Rhizobium sp. S163]|uniref:helix-turn-helix domain-containing protein n=1 Tax=Rhizobium sp. S163 TaxID=3055039 RepID=UPI0025A99D9E|nr:helix-turn-helix domain-containing protein [Rhizobium sp. S163]MDM9647713.1 helix-turn-helix domain-containing protein [Rhizobium sp. S163]
MTKAPAWDRHSILAELRRKGMTLARLAELKELSKSGVRNIWTRPNSLAERAIADFLEVDVEKLFPGRYPKRRSHILAPEFAPKSKADASTRSAA